MTMPFSKAARALCAVMLCAAGTAAAQFPAPGDAVVDPQALADRIQAEVAEIRGLAFVRPVKVENQSQEEFAIFLERQVAELVPPSIAEHYGTIVRKVGLYRGTADLEFEGLMKGVMTSQVAAYYDPARSTFFVLYDEMPPLVAGTVYAHELYHGLQDQHFDLDAYIRAGQRDRSLSDDELLARQAVVEGEATYVMTLWTMRSMLGSVPPRAMLQPTITLQSQMDVEALKTMLRSGAGATFGRDVAATVEAMDEIPAFILETLVGAYLKGLVFVFAVEERGWGEVEKLYKEYPPQSTEQILHPEKWFARETPWRFEWPELERESLFDGWQVLEENVLGEVQWRIVLAEHGLRAEAETVAAGWNGDRWAVLRNERSGALLLLAATAWDTEDDAIEFADAYERLLAVKYADAAEPVRVVRNGMDVLIVEGGSEDDLDAFVEFLSSARKTKTR